MAPAPKRCRGRGGIAGSSYVYSRTTNRQNWDEENMEKALIAIQNKESRADPEQCCWGVPELLGGCELDGAKRRRASATEAARSACRGSCGRGPGAQK